MTSYFESIERPARAAFACAALFFMAGTPLAEAQTVLSCTGTQAGGCYDFTITNNQQTTGFVQVQVLYTQSASNTNTMNITSIQAVYADKTGVAIPRAPTSTDFAPAVTSFSLTTGTNPTFDWDDKEIRNLTFSFTSSSFNGNTIVQNFNDPNNFRVDITDNSGNFNCGNRCEYRPTSSLDLPPIGAAVPEIDGGQLPKALLLLATAYAIWQRQRYRRAPLLQGTTPA